MDGGDTINVLRPKQPETLDGERVTSLHWSLTLSLTRGGLKKYDTTAGDSWCYPILLGHFTFIFSRNWQVKIIRWWVFLIFRNFCYKAAVVTKYVGPNWYIFCNDQKSNWKLFSVTVTYKLETGRSGVRRIIRITVNLRTCLLKWKHTSFWK